MIDCLRRSRSFSSSNDHLAIGRRHATRGIQSAYRSAHLAVHNHFPLTVYFCAKIPAQFVQIDVSTRREESLHFNLASIFQNYSLNLRILPPNLRHASQINADSVFLEPPGMTRVPPC